MLRVAYIDHTARWSGGEVALYNILTHLGSHVEPLVILAEEGVLADRLREKGIQVRVITMNEKVRNRNRNAVNMQIVSAAFQLLSYGRGLARILKEEQVVCVHTNSLKSAFYGAVAAKLAGIPLIWHIRDHIGEPYLKPVVAKAIRLLSRILPNGVIANSNSTLNALKLPKSKKTLVVYSSFAKAINPIPSVTVLKPKFTVLLVGRLAEWKGQHILLEAARSFLPDQHVQFWLAGDALFGEDAYKEELIRQIEVYGLTNVTLLGHVEHIQELMQQADLLVHTSITPEPFGQVIVEGMAAGLPVIASNEGGPTETVVHGETGLLITPGDPALLARSIRELLGNPEERRRMSENGRKRVQEHFVIERTVTQITNYYEGLISNI
ncbi:glycosyltransferase family 4 protein [Paenibacillus sp. WQ 127069]|uniref:Glycosyltransferase family 4 protein n=1 Tax=Paenibacillus baimaensis TaxID=2982185 RepID=A0ABT2U9I3_9BACL|nr:glycosyltransferase family 4 protein [Paenibacillus sp. WQ 127069]MCU6791298.1 glycosyltransferase family 4 protein [Paenibacillus sp. WQ 127069]